MRLITEYLSTKAKQVKADIPDNLEKLMLEFDTKNDLPKGMWANGKSLRLIAKSAAEIFGDIVIKILLPNGNDKNNIYNDSSFNCFGSAKQIYKDVEGLMPFTKSPIRANAAKSLFWGKNKIQNGNYLPFQAYSDAFYVKQNASEIINDIPTFYLVRYYESFM